MALARGTSTTRVSIINTSANFMVTAILGFLVFMEKLPPLWWAGAALLVAGNVIIGRREEGKIEVTGEPRGLRADVDASATEEEEEREELLQEDVELEDEVK